MDTSIPHAVSEEVLKLVAHCPVCDRSAHGTDVRILETSGDTFRLHVGCRRCRSSTVAMVVASPPALTAVAVLTDLSVSDAERLRSASPISINDVIETHAWMEQGTWRRAFEPQGAPRRTQVRERTRGRRIDK